MESILSSPVKPNDWLANSLMNLLVDYYPEVQFRPYGSGATRENILPALKELQLGYLCIYAKGHSGYTTFSSALRTEHRMLGQDMPAFFREVTREANTKLVLYYSGQLDGIAGMRHPEWRMLGLDGKPLQYFSDFQHFVSYANCPLSEYFDEWVAVHLREMIGRYDPDGIWVDGDWAGPCYCPRCQERFRQETGWHEPWGDVQQRRDFLTRYAQVWNKITHEWRTRFSTYVKSLKPDCVYSAGNVSPRREYLAPFDWRSGDFFSPGFFFLHDMSRMMRWYSTLGVPYDAYVCDTSFTHARKNVQSRSKTLSRMMQESAVVASNGGAVGYWTYPMPNGAFVPSRMDKACTVRQFLREREDVFLHTRSVGWTAILCCDTAAPIFGSSNIAGAAKALMALHRSPNVVDETGISADMPYDLVVLPEQPMLAVETVAKLEEWVSRGGRLLTSGVSIGSAELRRLIGVRKVRQAAVREGHVLPRSSKDPTGVHSAWDELSLDGAEELYPLYLSWDQFNPEIRQLPENWPMHGVLDEEKPELAGFPAAILCRIGKGMVVHIATDIFSQYANLGDPQMLWWLREIVDILQPNPLFRTSTWSWVDISLRQKGNALLVHLVNCNPGRDVARLNTNDLWVDEIPPVGPIKVWIRSVDKPAGVVAEPGGVLVDSKWEDGVLEVVLPCLEIHSCLVISGWTRPKELA
ncbi:MAG: alpha-L-fucosidase [Chloroflexi bacterium]|nr:alpha-L-fucosidase [Chloroflexota bacterium]